MASAKQGLPSTPSRASAKRPAPEGEEAEDPVVRRSTLDDFETRLQAQVSASIQGAVSAALSSFMPGFKELAAETDK
eukprot:14040834-Alexandrium_andersonii.AAC.1